MTTIVSNDGTGISQGTTPTTGNSGGNGATAWDAVALGGTSTCISDNAHPLSSAFNSQAYKIASTTSASATLNWGAAMGTKTTVWWRLYCYFTANPTNLHRLWTFFNGGSGGSSAGAMEITTTGKLDLRAGAGALANSTSKQSIPLNTWFRIEGFVTGSATVGQMEYKLFLSADSTAADWITTSAANLNTIGTLDFYKFGFSTAVANAGPYWMSGIGLSDTAYLGPNISLAGPQLLVRAKSPTGSTLLIPGKVIPGRPKKPGKHSSNISMSATATAAVAVSAPAGTVVITGGDKTLSGPVAAVSVAASAGGWAVSVPGALGAVAVSAPAGTAVVISAGALGAVAVAAAAGGWGVSVPGALGSVAVAAPAGTPVVTAAGAVASVAVTAPAGTVTAEIPGALGAVAVSAPAGGWAVSVPGALGVVSVAAPPGDVSIPTVVPGEVAAVAVSAPAGTAVVTAPGPAGAVAVSAPAGSVSGSLSGQVAAVAVAAPAGIAQVIAPGPAANVSAAALAGAWAVTVPGASGTVGVSALAGEVVITLDGPAATVGIEAIGGMAEVTIAGVAALAGVRAVPGRVIGQIKNELGAAAGSVFILDRRAASARLTRLAGAATVPGHLSGDAEVEGHLAGSATVTGRLAGTAAQPL